MAVDCVPVMSIASRRHLQSAGSCCLAVTGTNATLGTRNFAVAEAKIWNSLPADLQTHSQLTVGERLKHHLFTSREDTPYKCSQYY